MKRYYVAVYSLYNNENILHVIQANTAVDAQLKLLANLGWDISNGIESLKEIEDVVSEAIEIKES